MRTFACHDLVVDWGNTDVTIALGQRPPGNILRGTGWAFQMHRKRHLCWALVHDVERKGTKSETRRGPHQVVDAMLPETRLDVRAILLDRENTQIA